MKVKVKKLHPDAKFPTKSHEEDFCYDVTAVSVEEIHPNVYKYHTGLAFEIVEDDEVLYSTSCEGFEDEVILTTPRSVKCADTIFPFYNSNVILSIDGRPRSSIHKTGLILANCTGTVDKIYRGEVSFVFYHVIPTLPKYEPGDRIAQIKLGFTLPMQFVEAKELSETDRGTGGFGSTGK